MLFIRGYETLKHQPDLMGKRYHVMSRRFCVNSYDVNNVQLFGKSKRKNTLIAGTHVDRMNEIVQISYQFVKIVMNCKEIVFYSEKRVTVCDNNARFGQS